MVMGSSKAADISNVMYATTLPLAKHKITTWGEHVESAANLTDGGSRLGLSFPVAGRGWAP